MGMMMMTMMDFFRLTAFFFGSEGGRGFKFFVFLLNL